MKLKSRTIVLVEQGVGFTAEDFVAVWNVRASNSGDPIAVVEHRPETYDADLLRIIGDVADFITIGTFIGVPTVREILRLLRGDSKEAPEPSQSIEIEVTTIERRDERIAKLVIRRRG
jgi:hypothetical protein